MDRSLNNSSFMLTENPLPSNLYQVPEEEFKTEKKESK